MIVVKNKASFLCVIGLAVSTICCGIALGAPQTSEHYIIHQDVLSCGGQDMASAGYDLLSTFAQSGGISGSKSSHYKNYWGFWHPLEIVVTPPAMPCLYLLLLDGPPSP